MNLEKMMVRDLRKDTILYAGAFRLRISDWFFLKKNISIGYIGLQNAVIHINRLQDSVWNYQFIIDHFASPKKEKTASKPIDLDLHKVDFENVTFDKIDRWNGQDMRVHFGSFVGDAREIDLEKKKYTLNSLFINQLDFYLYDYHALKPRKPTIEKPRTGMYFNKGDIALEIDSLNLKNSSITIFKQLKNRKPYPYFDTHHLQFTKVNLSAANFKFNKDTITARMNLAAHERSGIIIKHLKANFKLTPSIMEFQRFDLAINKSNLRNYLAFHFHDFNDDMGEFETNINLDVRFLHSTAYTDDIAYIEPSLKSWKKRIDMSLHLFGTVRDFKAKGIVMRLDQHTFLSGDLRMRGFPNLDTSHLQFENLNLQTTRLEAAPIVERFKTLTSPDLDAMGVMQYRGRFEGTPHDFFTEGNFSTAIGSAYVKAKMTFPEVGEPTYSGNITTRQFNLGKFVHSPVIGEVDFHGEFKGSSYKLSQARSSLNGHFNSIKLNGYPYSDIDVNGVIQKKYFTGTLNISDTNINLLSNIQIDLNGKAPKFNVIGDLQNAHLQKLNLLKENFILTGLFDLDFEGNNIDNYIGSAKILNASLKKDTFKLNFDSLSIQASQLDAQRKQLTIQSNEFDVRLRGKYKVLDLPNSFQSFLHQYYPSIISEPQHFPLDQKFLLTIDTRNFTKYTELFFPGFSGLDSAELIGGINTIDSNVFYVKAHVPDFNIKRNKFRGTDIVGRGDLNTLAINGQVDSVFTSDSFYFPNTELNIKSISDHSTVDLKTKASSSLDDAHLMADVYTLNDGVKIDVQPSFFILNNKKWNIDKEGEIIIRKQFASAKNVKFSQGLQELVVETSNDPDKKSNDLKVIMKNISIGDFAPLVLKNPKLDGIANGEVVMHNFFGQFNIDANIKAEEFKLNDDSVGIVNIKGHFNPKSKLVNYTVNSDNEKYHFGIHGDYNTSDTAQSPLNANIELADARIFILNQFLSSLFTDMSGQSEGQLHIGGSFKSPVITGITHLKKAELTVIYTQVHYWVDSATINFYPDRIDMGNLTLRDEKKNIANVQGIIYENALDDMKFDINITTDKLLALNTQAKDNPMFYGRAFCKGQFTIKGPQENMQMYVGVEAADSSHIYIPTTSSRESSNVDYIIFKQYGNNGNKKPKIPGQITVDLDLTANNLVNIDVIMDAQTGDVIKATGSGKLNIHVPAEGSMTMKGRYNIEKGRYDFNFQSFIKKPFDLMENGNNYIEWTGDPYNANIRIDASYTATHVSLNDLVSAQTGNIINGNVRGYRGDVYVIAQLTGKLMHPDIKFHLDFPTGSTIKNDPDFALFLNRLASDDNEMLKQVTYLIVFGSFAPYGANSAATNFASVGVNSISSIITSEFNKLVSGVLYKLTGSRDLQFDLSTSTYSSASWYGGNAASAKLDRQAVNLKLNQSILNGKVIITVGGDLDFNLAASSSTGNFQWLPDISVQIVLSKDRKLRAIIFNRSSLDIGSSAASGLGRRNRMGVSLSYTRDFEHMFGDKKKKIKVETDSSAQKKTK
ncbi:translocation/assembly module TamB domain-containing protein [Rhizosphaericola mali]|uniref:Translocation and assembly module TamB C-terminal domain-containing protein n=1 Tax=Rhizosphaericola mali TaxID=2545455 RepID=A0A5P2G8Y9_9BACT|nr:translocation/assembly module TamB domain-containing protein [Rhizosphaericola mali]QES90180.1 hypothetical protein E0W69_016495 [Rhizosphaericola mali]